MDAFWEAMGTVFPAIAVSLLTVAALALVRLITPTVRWSRRLKHDGEIYGMLSEGKERDVWGASVTAQAERLRLYREDLSIGAQIVAWYAFFVLLLTPVAIALEASLGWPNVRAITLADIPSVIFGGLLLLMNLAVAVVVTIRLIQGRSTTFESYSGGYYPKYDAQLRAARRRSVKRARVAMRLRALRLAEYEAARAARLAAKAKPPDRADEI